MRIVTISDSSGWKILLVISFILLTVPVVYAQERKLPSDPKLESIAHFRLSEQTVIKNIAWLAITPRDTLMASRRIKEEFSLKWIYECPYVSVVVEPYVMKLSSKNADILLSFIFGYTLFQLHHPDDKNLAKANIAGLNMLIEDYSRNLKFLKRDTAIDELIKIQSSGNLSAWIETKLGKIKK